MSSRSPKPCGGTPPPGQPRERDCVPCDIQPFCRNHYYTGKLLTERDFLAEQRYLRDKLRLHYRELHGWGVVCGLKVRPHPYCPDRKIIIEPGLAIDRCGYEIVVPREVQIELPRPPASRDDEPCPPDEREEAAEPNVKRPAGYGEDDCPEPKRTYAICLSYTECEVEFAPAPFDECGCATGDRQKPNRICESFTIELIEGEPERPDQCGDDDCELIYGQLLDACGHPTRASCLPLAVIAEYEPGERLTADRIDNETYRTMLPSVRVHEDVLRCILRKLPTRRAVTRIEDINWVHDEQYRCRDFFRLFTGEGPSSSAFEIAFGGAVRPEGLSPRTFQAVVVRHAHHELRGGPMELAPSRVWHTGDRRFALQIDRSWAERHLEGQRFDVYLTLRCNLIVDSNGVAVDGNLMGAVNDDTYGAALPSGNGVPGGTFESWISVRP